MKKMFFSILIIFVFYFQINSEEKYHKIKLEDFQIKSVSIFRNIELTNKQYSQINKKIRKFNIGGIDSYAPEGWFHAIWKKSDEIWIETYMITNFEKIIIEFETDENDSVNDSIKLNIDLNGDFYLEGKNIKVNEIISIINKLEKSNPEELNIYISRPPVDKLKVNNKITNTILKIKSYSKNKKIYIQDNL
jgi:hypothetical protein